MLAYPNIDPVFIHLGPLQIRWYGVAYVLGVVLGMRLAYPSLRRLGLSRDAIWDFPTYLILGIVLGGRLGYVCLYDLPYFIEHPAQIIAIWQGGMSYHGAALGTVAATGLFARRHRISMWSILDLLAWGSTIGIGFGRMANFINGELFGRITAVPWGIVFPEGGPLPRHPSQLYEAFGEGVVLFIILSLLRRYGKLKDGQLFGGYLMGYGAIRFCIEFFREPDSQVGYLFGALTMGQLLCITMVLGGAVCFRLRRSLR